MIAEIQNPPSSAPESKYADVVVNPNGSEIGAVAVLEVEGSADAAGEFSVQETDVSEYGSLSLQRKGTFNLTDTFECSNDRLTWALCPMQNVALVPLAENTSVTGSGTGIYACNVNFKWFRSRVSVYTSGQVDTVLIGRTLPANLPTQPTWQDDGKIVSTKQSLTATAPATATIGTASSQVVASTAARKGLIITNTHPTQRVSLAFGTAAVLDSGVTLMAGQSYVMDEYSFHTGAVNAWASGAGTVLSVQQFTT